MATADDDVSLEDRIKFNIDVVRPFFLDNLKCTNLLMYIPFKPGDGRKIRVSEKDGEPDTVELFLKCLKAIDEPGAYAAFRDALIEEGFDHIASVLQGGDIVENHTEHCKLINVVFARGFVEELDPSQVIHYLREYELLTESDESKIRNIQENHSRAEAVLVLLDCVPRRKRDWYDKFMTVMLEMYPLLAGEVDPDFKEKKETQKSAKCMDETDMGTMEEPPMTVTGGPYKFHGNLGADTDGAVEKGCTESMEKETPKADLDSPETPKVDMESPQESSEQAARKRLFDEETPQVSQETLHVQDTSQVNQNTSQEREGTVLNDLSVHRLASVQSIEEIKEILTGDQTQNLNVSLGEDLTASKGVVMSKNIEPGTEDVVYQREQAEDDTRPVKSLTLRPYQDELARPALAGMNTIICAPTGSGKTYVATKIMQEHLKKRGVRKIAFFANQVALVNQQFKVIKDYMPREYRIRELSGDTEEALKVPLKELLLRNDVLVLTPQILVDALRDKEVSSLSEFTLLVFDECHHTNSRHPFNRIMFSYMDRKLDESVEEDQKHLPQIVGLTASVGVGKAKSITGAVDHICKLCANLDAYGGVCTVSEYEEDLAKHARTVGMDVKQTQRRKQDIFKIVVSDNLMSPIEKMMVSPQKLSQFEGQPKFVQCLHPPVERGGDQYTQWVSNLKREVAKIEDQTVRRFYFSCRRMLELYNKSLAINEDCRTKDALKYLEKELEKLYSAGIFMDNTDNLLKEQFEIMRPRLQDASQNPMCINPKLTTLCRMIMSAFEKERESRCMVFVKTLDLALALKQWMDDDPNLSYLKPDRFVGQNASAEKGGMTRNQQLDAAELFRKGDHKVIIATSVAEEGMDFSQCNLVIRYEYVTNEIAMVQAKGRARAKDSQFVVLTGKTQGTAEKEELNLIREMMMGQAIIRLQTEIHNNLQHFQEDILSKQKAAKAERDHEALNRKGRILSDDEFEIRCQKCNMLSCFSTDVRTIKDTNHVVIDPEFQDKFRATPHPRPCSMGRDMEKRSKIACRKCGLDWGIGVIYRNWIFAVIKIESFLTIDMMGRRDSPRKWKNAPFIPPEMTEDEITNYRSLDMSQ